MSSANSLPFSIERVAGDEPFKIVPKNEILFPWNEEKRNEMHKLRTPNLMFPHLRARVDTGRPEVSFRSGCRGFSGLVPQPLFMKSKVCSEEQT
jgi:hypothetical protein